RARRGGARGDRRGDRRRERRARDLVRRPRRRRGRSCREARRRSGARVRREIRGRRGGRARPRRRRRPGQRLAQRRRRSGRRRARRRPSTERGAVIYELLFPLRHEASWLGWLNVLRYVPFRIIAATMTAMLLSFLLAPWFIRELQKKQIGQVVRADGP